MFQKAYIFLLTAAARANTISVALNTKSAQKQKRQKPNNDFSQVVVLRKKAKTTLEKTLANNPLTL